LESLVDLFYVNGEVIRGSGLTLCGSHEKRENRSYTKRGEHRGIGAGNGEL